MKLKKSQFCWINKLFFGLGLGLFATVLITGCASNENKEENSISTEMIDHPDEDTKQKPEFQFEKETHDFGQIKEGEKVTHSFQFKNSGKKPLIISDASASCGCTVPNYPQKPVKPGEKAIIDVAFDSDGKSGQFKKSVTLLANTMPNTKKIHIKGEVIKNQ